MYCWQCSARVRRRDTTCRHCGAALERSPVLGLHGRVVSSRRLTHIAWAALFVLLLLAVGAAVLRPPNLLTVTVPDVVGLSPDGAKAKLVRAGLTPLLHWSESGNSSLWNLVAQQMPTAGLHASRGEEVVLLVFVKEGTSPLTTPEEQQRIAAASRPSAYLPQLEEGESPPKAATKAPAHPAKKPSKPYRYAGVADVVGRRLAEARRQLRSEGLTAVVDRRTYSEWAPSGSVVKQTPPGGSDPPRDDIVHLVISSGKSVRMPALVGASESEAQHLLLRLGLRPQVTRRNASASQGTVVGTEPRGGKLLPPHAPVRLAVSKGPWSAPAPPRETPEVHSSPPPNRHSDTQWTKPVRKQPKKPPKKRPRGATGTLRVDAEPVGCQIWIYVDHGQAIGACPKEIPLKPGTHTITLWDTTHLKDTTVKVRIKPGQTLHLSRQLH